MAKLDEKPVRKGKFKGRKMARVVLDDFTGSILAIVFSELWEQAKSKIKEDGVIFMTGEVKSLENPEIIAGQVFLPDEFMEARVNGLVLSIDTNTALEKGKLDELANLLKAFPGNKRIYFKVYIDGETAILKAAKEFSVTITEKLLEGIEGILGEKSVGFLPNPFFKTPKRIKAPA